MKKLLKITAVLAVIFGVLLVAAYITLRIMFPAEKVQAMAQQYAQNYLQREVTFSGVSFNLVGITINDLAISEAHTFEQGTFIKAEQAVIKFALAPLLRKQIKIDTVGLKGLEFYAIRGTDGKLNFDDLLTSEETSAAYAEEKKEAPSSPVFGLIAEDMYAKRCNLYYSDLSAQTSVSVTDLNLDIQDFDLAEPFNAKLQFTLGYKDSEREISLPIKSALTIDLANLNNEQAYVTLQNLTTAYKKIMVDIKGGVKNFNNPIANLQGTLDDISSKSLADIAADLPHFELPVLTFNIDTETDLDASTAKIVQAKLALANSYLTTTGQVGWGGQTSTYDTQTDLNLNLGEIGTMSHLLDGYSMAGTITGKLTATEKNGGQDVRGTITLRDVKLEYAPVTLSELNATVVLSSLANISSKDIAGKINEAPFTSFFIYKNLGNIMDIVFNADLSKLTLKDYGTTEQRTAKNSNTDSASTSSTATSNTPETLFNLKSNINIGPIDVPYFSSNGAKLTADLQKASASMKQANGTVTFTLENGSINDLLSFVKESKIVKIIFLPLTLVQKVTSKLGVNILPSKNDEDKGKIKFKEGSGTYVFTNGIMDLKETHMNTSVSKITASGNINFQTEKLDMRVNASVLTSQTPIVIKIGGTMSDPSGKLDVAQTAVSLVTGIVNYKTPGAVAGSAAGATKAVANTGTDAVKATVNTAADTVKAIGNLFKSKSSDGKNKE